MKTTNLFKVMMVAGAIVLSANGFSQSKEMDKMKDKVEKKADHEKEKGNKEMKDQKDKMDKKADKMKDKADKQADKAKDDVKAQGNAYGKDKDGKSGKEFGQERSAEAQAKYKAQKENLDKREAEINTWRKQLDEARKKNAGNKEKLSKIEEAAKKVDETEAQIKKARTGLELLK